LILSLNNTKIKLRPTGYSQCSGTSGNIMNPTAYASNSYNTYIFKFSICSINGFKSNLLSPDLRYLL